MRWLTMLWWHTAANDAKQQLDEVELELGEIRHRQQSAIQHLEQKLKLLELEVEFYRAQSQPDTQDPPRADC